MSDRLTIRISPQDKEMLNLLVLRNGFTSQSEALRWLIHEKSGCDTVTAQVNELKKLLEPFSRIDIQQFMYHVARASVAPVAAVQLRDKATGDILNEQVKQAAEKIATRLTSTGN